MLARAQSIVQVISDEISRHQKAIEIDNTISKITVEVIIGKRAGSAVKVRYFTTSEVDLTAVASDKGLREASYGR